MKKAYTKKVSIFDTDWDLFVAETIALGIELSEGFEAGRVKHHLQFWQSITNDPVIWTDNRH